MLQMAPTSPSGRAVSASRRRGALIRDMAPRPTGDARQRERDVILPDGTTHACGRTHIGGASRLSSRSGPGMWLG
jgi:hypothetical protein